MSKLLFDEAPIVVDTVLATKIGLNEAIVLQQIHYWIEINHKKDINQYDGRYWTFSSIKEWNKCFPFFGEKTLRRVFLNLEKQGILLTGNFNKLRMDRTKWYTIDYDKLHEYINESDNEKGVEEQRGSEEENAEGQNDQMQFPKTENASGQNDQMQVDKVTECKRSKCPNASGQNDQTNTRDFTETSSEIYSETSSTSLSDVVAFFQNNFYLPKAFEAEILTDWSKRYPSDLVIEAMKIARKSNARNLKYIERVLENWEQEGINSVTLLRVREDKRNGNKGRIGQDSQHSKNSNEPDQYDGIGFSL